MVHVGGKNAKMNVKVEEGQEVELRFVDSPELILEGQGILLDILFQDDEVIAVSKPAGMVVHPAPGSWAGTFVNALVYHLELQEKNFPIVERLPDGEHNPTLRPGIVHRLDKGTTGVLLAGKNPTVQAELATLFAERQHRRTPVLSDDVYGKKDWYRRLQQSTGVTRLLLHAHSLEFTHPSTGEVISVVAPLPPDMGAVVPRIYPQVDDRHAEWLGPEKDVDEDHEEGEDQTPLDTCRKTCGTTACT